jgi:site-specific recombinase XerD
MSTEHSITPISQDDNRSVLIPSGAVKDKLSRLSRFAGWLDDTGVTWHNPDLAAYRDFLKSEYGLANSSIAAHLSTIRGQYNSLLRDNAVRDRLYQMTPADTSPADRKAFVDEALERLKNAVDPSTAKVTVKVVQDKADSEIGLRLTGQEAATLIDKPGLDTLMGLRDTAIIFLMLSTGIREMELCALNVDDLRQTFKGALALRIRKGKGSKQRMVVYGQMACALNAVDAWLTAAGITSGPVFRGFYRGGKRIRETRLTVRAINQILERYKIQVGSEWRKVNPHDLRRTYARRLYDTGMRILDIQQNLGHSDHKTTEKYIGAGSATDRQPTSLYPVNSILARLEKCRLIA